MLACPPAPPPNRRTGPEPLLTLASYRRSQGRIIFGHLMNVQQVEQQAHMAGGTQGDRCGSSGGGRHGWAGRTCLLYVEVGAPLYGNRF